MVDVSGIAYFGPILAYLLVALVVGAVLFKLELFGKHPWLVAFVALAVASLFIASASVVRFVETITPWFAALVVSLVFLLMIMVFAGHKQDGDFAKGVGKFFVFAAIAIFVVSGVVIFSDTVTPYLPGYQYEGNSFTDWIYSPPVWGAIILLAVAWLVIWVMFKFSGGK